MPAGPNADLRRRLEPIPGIEVRPGAPLARYTTFRIGGPAELLVTATSERALGRLLGELGETPFQLLGLGSNVLIPDDGLPGVVLRLAGGFRRVRLLGTAVEAGGAVALGRLARLTADASLTGLEALSGFPSTVGGAVYMNAGSYGTEIGDVLDWATVMGRDGRRRRLAVGELEPSYRRTVLEGSGSIVTRARFVLARGDREASLARIEELHRRRWSSLPSGRHAGSVFRNPEGEYAGRLIEECGLKGTRRGGARISPKHGNVIVNQGGATAADVLELMLLARRRVERRRGVRLEPELVLTGSLAGTWRRETSRADGPDIIPPTRESAETGGFS